MRTSTLRYCAGSCRRIVFFLALISYAALGDPSVWCEEESNSLYQRAMKARSEGNLAECAVFLEQALGNHPADAEIMKQYAIVLSHLGRHSEALQWFEKVQQRNPDDAEASLGVARVTSWQGNYDEAIRLYESLLESHPEAVEAYLGLANVWSWKGDHERAIENAERYVEHVPDDPEGYIILGRMYRRKEAFDISREYYSKALEFDADNKEAIEGVELPPQPKRFRLDTGYSYTGINRRSDWNHQHIQLSYAVNPRTTLVGVVSRNRRNRTEDIIYGGELYWDLTENVNLRLGSGFTPNSDFSPKTFYLSEISHKLPFASSIVFGYNRLNFPEGAVDIATAELYHYFGDKSYISAKYYRTFHFSDDDTDSYAVRLNHELTDSVVLRGGMARGAEASDILSTGEADVIDIDSYFGGVVVSLFDGHGISLDYAYEDRDTGFEHHTFSVGYYVEF